MTHRAPEWLSEFQSLFSSVIRSPLSRHTGILEADTSGYPPALLERLQPGAALPVADQMAVYNRQYWARLFSVLHGAFPLASRIVGYWELNTDTVLVMPGSVDNRSLAPQPEIVPYDIAYRNAAEVLAELAKTVCDVHRVHLAVENCPGKFLVSPLEFAGLVDVIGSPWVGCCFDTGNALWYGFPEHWVSILGPRIKRVHLKDNRSPPDGAVTATPLLAGDVNWPAVRDGLAAIGYDGWLIAEVYPHYRFHPERLVFDTSAAIDAIFGIHPEVEVRP